MFQSDVEEWICGYLSEKTPEHNNIPRCPFAKKALLSKQVYFEEAHSEEELFGIVERAVNEWDDDTHQAVIIWLNWDVDDHARISLADVCRTFYGINRDHLFIEERRTLNNTVYDMILMHRFSEMQHAKRQLKKKGYYQNNT
jgi:hypothetical protein